MDTDALLAPYCDISGECLLSREKKAVGRYNRPRMSKHFCKRAGIHWISPATSMCRFVFFNNNPEVDKNYCIVLSCGNQNCVRASHCRAGVLNLKNYNMLE